MDNTPTNHYWDQSNALQMFESRNVRSAMDTVASNLERPCVTWQGDNNAGGFLMDITAAF